MSTSSVETVISSIHPLTPRVKQFFLRTEGHTFDYRPGQHTRIVLPRDGEDDIRRPYTPVNLPGSRSLVLAIKTYEEGTVSAYMHNTAIGDTVRVQSLGGSLYLRDGSVPLVMVSTGTGITPMLAILRHALQEGHEQPITFIFGERTQSDLMYRGVLDLLAAEHENLNVVYVLSDEDWNGPTGLVQDHLEQVVDDLSRTHCYVCGVPAMVVATEKRLHELGAPDEQIFSEGWEADAL